MTQMDEFLRHARNTNQVSGISNVNWTHNRESSGKILWDEQPVDFWESDQAKYNAICVIRKEGSKYVITFKDHQVCRGGEEGNYKKAVLLAYNIIESRMAELYLSFKIEDHDFMYPKLIADLTEEVQSNYNK